MFKALPLFCKSWQTKPNCHALLYFSGKAPGVGEKIPQGTLQPSWAGTQGKLCVPQYPLCTGPVLLFSPDYINPITSG